MNIPFFSVLEKRIVKFVVKRLIGEFLAEEISLDDLDVRLLSGAFSLSDLRLNVQCINDKLVNSPFLLTSGHIGCLSVSVPYASLIQDPIVIKADDVRLHFRLKTFNDIWGTQSLHSSRIVREEDILLKSILLGDVKREDVEHDLLSTSSEKAVPAYTNAPSENLDSSPEDEQISVIGSLLDRLLSNVTLEFSNLTISVAFESAEDIDRKLVLQFPRLAISGPTTNASAWQEDVVEKNIIIEGLRIFFGLCTDSRTSSSFSSRDDLSEEGIEVSNSESVDAESVFVSLPSSEPTVLRLSLNGKPAAATTVDLAVSCPAFHVLLSPMIFASVPAFSEALSSSMKHVAAASLSPDRADSAFGVVRPLTDLLLKSALYSSIQIRGHSHRDGSDDEFVDCYDDLGHPQPEDHTAVPQHRDSVPSESNVKVSFAIERFTISFVAGLPCTGSLVVTIPSLVLSLNFATGTFSSFRLSSPGCAITYSSGRVDTVMSTSSPVEISASRSLSGLETVVKISNVFLNLVPEASTALMQFLFSLRDLVLAGSAEADASSTSASSLVTVLADKVSIGVIGQRSGDTRAAVSGYRFDVENVSIRVEAEVVVTLSECSGRLLAEDDESIFALSTSDDIVIHVPLSPVSKQKALSTANGALLSDPWILRETDRLRASSESPVFAVYIDCGRVSVSWSAQSYAKFVTVVTGTVEALSRGKSLVSSPVSTIQMDTFLILNVSSLLVELDFPYPQPAIRVSGQGLNCFVLSGPSSSDTFFLFRQASFAYWYGPHVDHRSAGSLSEFDNPRPADTRSLLRTSHRIASLPTDAAVGFGHVRTYFDTTWNVSKTCLTFRFRSLILDYCDETGKWDWIMSLFQFVSTKSVDSQVSTDDANSATDVDVSFQDSIICYTPLQSVSDGRVIVLLDKLLLTTTVATKQDSKISIDVTSAVFFFHPCFHEDILHMRRCRLYLRSDENPVMADYLVKLGFVDALAVSGISIAMIYPLAPFSRDNIASQVICNGGSFVLGTCKDSFSVFTHLVGVFVSSLSPSTAPSDDGHGTPASKAPLSPQSDASFTTSASRLVPDDVEPAVSFSSDQSLVDVKRALSTGAPGVSRNIGRDARRVHFAPDRNLSVKEDHFQSGPSRTFGRTAKNESAADVYGEQRPVGVADAYEVDGQGMCYVDLLPADEDHSHVLASQPDLSEASSATLRNETDSGSLLYRRLIVVSQDTVDLLEKPLPTTSSEPSGGFLHGQIGWSIIHDYLSPPKKDPRSTISSRLKSYEIPEMAVIFQNISLTWKIFGGSDFDQQRGRDTTRQIEVVVQGMELFLFFFPRPAKSPSRSHCSMHLECALQNVEVFDRIQSSERNKIFYCWNKGGRTRESGDNLLYVLWDVSTPYNAGQSEDDEEVQSELDEAGSRSSRAQASENRIMFKILPLRLNVDQDALDFMLDFFSKGSSEIHVKEIGVIPPSPTHSESTSEVNSGREETVKYNPTYFQIFSMMEDTSVKIDYHPKRIDYVKLKDGDYLELLNFFPLSGVELRFRALCARGCSGVGEVIEQFANVWIPDIRRSQLHKCVGGIPPFRTLYRLGSGVADLFIMPIEQYRKDRRLLRGISKGIQSLVRNVTSETFGLAANAAYGVQTVLTSVGASVDLDDSATAAQHGSDGHPHSAYHSDLFDAASSSSASSASVSLDDPHSQAAQHRTPRSLSEGLVQAAGDLRGGMHNAYRALVFVPFEDGSGVKNAVRAVPMAIFSPIAGVAGAIGKAAEGAKNALDPMEEEELLQLYK